MGSTFVPVEDDVAGLEVAVYYQRPAVLMKVLQFNCCSVIGHVKAD